MYLSRSARSAALAEAAKHGIESDDAERTVKQALDAAVLGLADEIAYKVTEAAGIEWITPNIWGQTGGNAMDATIARAVIEKALEDETYEGETPDDDDKAVEVANGLVEMAQDAWNQNIRGPEVEAILEIAKGGENGDGPKAKSAPSRPKPAAAKPKPAAGKGRPARPAKEPDPEPDDPRATTEPWTDYDGTAVDDVIEGIEVWAEQENTDDVAHVLVYEQAHQNRKRIVEKILELFPDLAPSEPEAAAPDPEPEPDEPFEGYNGLKAADIKSSVDEWFSGDIDNADALTWLDNAFNYESMGRTGKNPRTTLLDYFDAKRKELRGEEEPQAAEAEAGDGADADASAPDAGGADAPARSTGGGKATRAAAGAGSASGAGFAAGDASTFVVTGTFGDAEQSIELVSTFAVGAVVADMHLRGATSVTSVASA